MEVFVFIVKLLSLLSAIFLFGFIITCYVIWNYLLRQDMANKKNLKGLFRAEHFAMGLTALQFFLSVLNLLLQGHALITPSINTVMLLLVAIAILVQIGFSLKKSVVQRHRNIHITMIHIVELLKIVGSLMLIYELMLEHTFMWFI